MKLYFRQGIARYQTDINAQPTFLQKSTLDAQYVDLIVSPTATVITFAQRDTDYVFEEPKTVLLAWGPFTNSLTKYLYWDINVLTAELTRGVTQYPPIYSGSSPNLPAIDQHWFNTIENVMYVFNGTRWIEKIRVFAAVYSSSAVLKPLAIGTQAGLNQEIDAGNIILDGFFKPLRQSDGSFVTSTTNMSVVGIATKKIRVEAELVSVLAQENIAKFNCVQVRAGRTCILARSNDRMSRVSGIASTDFNIGQTGDVLTSGLVRSDTWLWPADKVNRPLFCGQNGELTLVPPITGVVQQVGSVYDSDAIFLNIFPSITLDHPDGISQPPPPPAPGTPVANFTASPLITSGTAPLTVNFINTSSNGPFNLVEWDVTNDGTVDSTLPNFTFTYVTAGTYSVRLRVQNGVGDDTEIKTGFITVAASPPATGKTNLQIRFVVDNQEDNTNIRVKSGDTFGVKLRVTNSGNLPATSIQRTFIVYDMKGQQTTMVSPPPGATVSRVSGGLQIVFAPIASLASGGSTDYPPFVLRAPNIRGMLSMNASVTSPEADSDIQNNNRALSIEVTK